MERLLARPAIAIPRPRPLHRLAGLLRRPRVLLWQHRRVRVVLLCLLLAVPLLGGGWLWLRQSSFVAVQRVQIVGVHGADAAEIEATLSTAAKRMSTLEVDPGALRAAVARYEVVRSLRVSPSFPHGLRLEVVEQLPVAVLLVDGSRTAAAADGVVLGAGMASGALPTIGSDIEPATGHAAVGDGVREALALLGAAPGPLAQRTKRVFLGPKGLEAQMQSGLLVYFGDASDPHAKWLSLARVLADPSSAGASYIDVRLPSRPAAGFPDGVAPPTSQSPAAGSSTASEPSGDAESTVAALAAGLSGGGAVTGTDGSAPSEASGALSGASPGSGSAPGETPAGSTGGAATAPEASAPATSGAAPAAPIESSSGATVAPSSEP